MRGRDIFKVVYPLLKLLSYLFFLLPRFIINWLWILADLFPGLLGVGFRYVLALRLAKNIGKNVFFGRGVEIKHWQNFEIGSNVSIHKDCYIDAVGGLVIKDDVSIAHNSSILTFEHTWENKDEPIRSNPVKLNSVTIENDVWIGCGCRILSGIVIRSRSIVAAGAVVNKDIESGSLVGGGTCKINQKVGNLKALFVHDHMFKTDGENVYSDKLPYTTWQRYLKHFDSLTIFARYSYETTDISKQPLSSGDNVVFELAPNISSIRAFFGRRKEQIERLEKLIYESDIVIARNSMYGNIAVKIAQKLNKPYILEIVSCPFNSLWNYGSLKGKLMAPISM